MRIPQNVSRGNRDGNTLRKIMFTVKVKEPSESAGSHEAQGCINILYNLSEIYWYQPFIWRSQLASPFMRSCMSNH